MTIDSISHKDLMHYRLQALIRDNDFLDFSYVGVHNGEHIYNIAGNIVPVSQIEGLDEV
jgi:hypothetical protein